MIPIVTKLVTYARYDGHRWRRSWPRLALLGRGDREDAVAEGLEP
jgi:hypothetical protein